MDKFKPHSRAARAKPEPPVLLPFVCFACHKTYKHTAHPAERDCPRCRRRMKVIEPSSELNTAKLLMLGGLLPLILGIAIVCALFMSARAAAGEGGGGMTEALLGLLILTASYLITLVAAGGGALWTRSILRKHVIPQSDSANVLWKIILTVVLLPMLAFIAYSAYIYALY